MQDHQLIYVTLDLRRGLWVSETTGAKVLCAQKSDLLLSLREHSNEIKPDIWCFEEEYPEAKIIPKTTFQLLSRSQTLNYLRRLGKNLRFIVFKPSGKIKRFIEQEGWSMMSADVKTCQLLEDKLSFAKLGEEFGLTTPRHQEIIWNQADGESYHESFGTPYIVQGRMGHAGSSTYVKRAGEPIEMLDGMRAKISEYVNGPTYTLNGYVSPSGKMIYGSLWRQLMGVKEWNSFEMGTLGVTALPEGEMDSSAYLALRDELQKFSKVFQSTGYRGWFGLDLMWDGREWYVIECNPRLTATVSLQCLQDNALGMRPLLGYQATHEELEEDDFRFLEAENTFSHVILRNSRERVWKTPRLLKSGIYRRNETGDWELVDRSPNAELLEPGMILLILSHPPGTHVESGSDYATLVFKGPVSDASGRIEDFIHDFYERVVLGRLLRNQDIWKDRFAQIDPEAGNQLFLYRRPFSATALESAKIRQRQTQVFAGEVLKHLGCVHEWNLLEKVDGTRGWLSPEVRLNQGIPASEFTLAKKESTDTTSFLKSWVGKPYLLAGNSEQGIDCSAFVQRYFWEVKGMLLPKYSQDQKVRSIRKEIHETPEDDDLVFMRSKRKGIFHVGLYREGKIWHSSIGIGVVEQTVDEVKEKYLIEHFGVISS